MFIDLHVHTRFSACSRLSLDEILEHAADRGLDGVCITDHHSVQALEQITPGLQPNGLRLFVGQEYSSDHGDFLIFGPRTAFPRGLTAQALLAAVAQAGGAAVAAHPFRPQCPVSEFIVRDKLCRIVESINGRNSPAANQSVTQWLRQHDLIECAGSDAHTLEELGKVRTRFHKAINSTADLVHALNNGLCVPHVNEIAGEKVYQNQRKILMPSIP
jgi:predicted metal-dependent phosphoesterase TrpH